jgi:hypothetical protein
LLIFIQEKGWVHLCDTLTFGDLSTNITAAVEACRKKIRERKLVALEKVIDNFRDDSLCDLVGTKARYDQSEVRCLTIARDVALFQKQALS